MEKSLFIAIIFGFLSFISYFYLYIHNYELKEEY